MNSILRSSVLWRQLSQPVRSAVGDSKFAANILLGNNVRFYAEQKPKAQHGKNGATDKNKEKITLYALDGSMSITSLEEANKLSKRRGLKLEKETDMDGKTQRAIYKLITISKIKQDEQAQGDGKSKIATPSTKGDKLLSLSNKIAENDLQSRLKHIQKWLNKQNKVIVVISGTVSDLATSEKIFKQMEEVSQGIGRIVQKRSKGSEIRFQILPIANNTENADQKSNPLNAEKNRN